MSVNTLFDKLQSLKASGDHYFQANNFNEAKSEYKKALNIVQIIKDTKNQIYSQHMPSYEQQLIAQIEACDKGRIPVAAPAGGCGDAYGRAQGGGGGGTNSQTDELEGMEKQLESQMTKVEGLKWSSIAGLKEAINSLQEAIELPRKYPHLFTGDRKPWSGILLYGPPGTGKSYLAKVVASEIQGSFFSISSSDLVSKWQGESEKLIRSLFSLARKKAPSVIFIDEIDSIATARTEGENEASRRIKTQLLVQMQGVTTDSDINHRVLVLGATNVPWEIDSAARRRFEKRIYIPLPDAPARTELFRIQLEKMWHNLSPEQINELVLNTEGFSGSDIATMCKEAAMQPVKRVSTTTYYRYCNIENQVIYLPCGQQGGNGTKTYDSMTQEERKRIYDFVSFGDFTNALNRARRTVSQDDLKRFEEWTAEFGIQG